MRLSGLEVILRAVRIRMDVGEQLENILASYVNLTESDKRYIIDKLEKPE